MKNIHQFLTALLASFTLLHVHATPAAKVGIPTRDTDNFVGDVINLIGLGLVTHINTIITLDSLVTDQVSTNFTVKNPLLLELTIDRAVASAGINGTEYAAFDHTFPAPGLIVPILGESNTTTFDGVTLTQGALKSLDIIPLGYLDLLNVDVYVRAATINGKLGIPIDITGLKQDNVSASYSIEF